MTTPRSRTEGSLPRTEPGGTVDDAAGPSRRRRVWAVLGLVVALVAVGVVVRSALAPAPGLATGSAPSAGVLDAGHTAFGAAFTYGDGLSVEVDEPERYTPSETAAGGGDGLATVVVEVAVTNGTEKTYRASTFAVTASSGGVEAEQVWDPAQGVELSGPAYAVPPGGTVRFRLAFAVQQADDLRLTVLPAIYGYAPLVVGTI